MSKKTTISTAIPKNASETAIIPSKGDKTDVSQKDNKTRDDKSQKTNINVEEISSEVRQKKGLLDRLEDFLGKYKGTVAFLSSIIVSVFSGLYYFLNRCFAVKYQGDCEDFYHVPGRYFSITIENRLFFVLCLILLVIIFLTPLFIDRIPQINTQTERKDKILNGLYMVFLSSMIGLEMGLLNIQNLTIIIEHVDGNYAPFVDKFLAIPPEVILAILMGAPIAMLLLLLISHRIKKVKIQSILIFFACLCAVVNFGLLIWGSSIKLNSTIRDKKNYEIVTVDEKEYALLSTVDGKELIMECTYTETNNRLQIRTDTYFFIDSQSGEKYRYVSLEEAPEILP